MGIFLLGCGEMGKVIGTDLLETYGGELTFADRDVKRAEDLAKRYPKKKVKTIAVDVKDKASLVKVIEDSKANVLINAVNYYFNLDVMAACLAAGVDYLDLGGMFHMTRKQLELDRDFKAKKILAVPGIGSSPGITNVLGAYGAAMLDKVTAMEISFADKDYTKYETSIALPYSILTLFEEFSDKPMIFENGEYKSVEPLVNVKEIKFPEPLNNAKCFYTLHSEAATLPSSFPTLLKCNFRGGFDIGLVDKIKFLIEIGFASNEKVALPEGQSVSPRDVIVTMTNKFIPTPDLKVDDLEFLRVELEGVLKGKKKTLVIYCESLTNKKWNIPAGSWDTGVAPSIVAQMMDSGGIKTKGVVPPEKAIDPKPFFKELERRGLKVFVEDYSNPKK
jgi:saccharopine dehydrogenase-like NADP-dependent oxidoreductase